MSYIGTQPTPQSLESRQEFTATASQTTFATSGYTVGYVDVYLNGVKLSTSDFTATNGSDVVLGSGAAAGDVLAVVMKNDHSDLVALPITDSQGNNVLSESGGVVTLTADTAIIEGSSSGDLVRITQTGSGNALVVEDSTNPDSTPFVVQSTGNVLVGQTTGSSSDTGHIFNPNGVAFHVRDGGVGLVVDRQTSDGDIALFRKDGTPVGSIGSIGGAYLYIGDVGGVGLGLIASAVRPVTNGANADNVYDLGVPTVRWNDIYLGNQPTVTSDQNEKQDIEELTEAEQRVAVACKGLLRKYRWKSAVAKKDDEARIHFGIIAQDLQAAFQAEGLDAGRYGMFMSNTWWETSETYTDDEGVEQTHTNSYETAEEAPEGAVERTRLGVRYSELLAFIIAAI